MQLSTYGARAPRGSVAVARGVALLLLLCLSVAQQAWAACSSPQTAHIASGGTVEFTCADIGFSSVRPNGGAGVESFHGNVEADATLRYTNNGDGATSVTFIADEVGGGPITFNITVDPPPATRPGAPTGVYATAAPGNAQDPATVQVAFSPPASNGGAPIIRYTATSSPGGFIVNGTGSPITLTGLARGTSYTFTVTATNGVGTSDASAPSAAITPTIFDTVVLTNPGPQNFGTSLNLSATTTSGRAVNYLSYSSSVCTVDASSGAVTLQQAGTCSITASVNNDGIYEGAFDSQSFQVNAVAPGAPTIGTATTSPAAAGQTTGTATVSFNVPASNGGSAITSYTVTSSPDGVTATGAGSPITITGLTLGRQYYFNVTANNGTTSSASGNSNSVIPTAQQIITLQNPGNVDFGTTTQLTVSSTSGLPVTVTSSTPTCSVDASNRLRALAPGTCTITATHNGGNGFEPATPVQQTFQVRIPGGAVNILTTSLPAPTRGVGYSQDIIATGGAQPYTFVLSGLLPQGLVLNPATGTIFGTPTRGGSAAFAIIVSDQAGQTASQNYLVTVVVPPLVITPGILPSGRVGTAYPTTTLSTTGGLGPYTYSVNTGPLPDGMVLSASGTLSGTPTAAGSYTFAVRATDKFGESGDASYTVVVGEDAPVAVNDTAATASNTAVSVAVTSNDTGGPVTSVAIAQAPSHGTAMVSGLNVVYTPAHNYFGTDTLSYIATGPGGTSSAATITVTVAAGAVPVAVAQKVTVMAGTSLTIAAAEGASNGPFTAAAVVSAPLRGTVQVQGTDLIYTPGDDVTGDVGFTYTLSNAFGASQPAAITVTVNPLPVAAPLAATAVAGRNLRVDLSSGARGGPFTAASVVSVSPANAGSARVESAADGYVLVFEPQPAFGGVAQIGYTLSNAYTTSAAAFVSVTVTARPDPSKDPEVLGVLSAQANATRRMATGQISNFQRRLEQLRSGSPAAGFSNGITLNSASARPVAMLEERERGQGPNAEGMSPHGYTALDDDSAANSSRSSAGALPGGASVWTGGAVQFGKDRARPGDASTDFTSQGVSIGADKLFAPGLVLGAGLGYGRDDTDVGQQSRSKAESYSAAVYASYRPADAFFIDSLLGYQWLALDSVRSVTDTGGRVFGSRDGTQWFGSLSVGYLLRNKDVQFTPYGRFDTAQASLDGFIERGDDLNALTYQAQTVKTSALSAGVLAQFALKRDYGLLTPQLRFEYGRNLEGAGNALMSYADLATTGGNVYRANLLQQSRDQTLLGGGLGLQTLGGWNLLLEYQLQLQSDLGDNQSVRIGIEKKFEP